MDEFSSVSRTPLIDRVFGFFERVSSGDRLIFTVLATIFIVAGAYTAVQFNQSVLATTPAAGGSISEGIVGTPRFINPVLAFTRADRDLSNLLYRSLMRIGPDGTLQPDLAESITVSTDGLVYNVVLKQNQRFHDGEIITSADVAFTVQQIQNVDIKSPIQGDWNGVTVEVLGEHELNFVLEKAYPAFKENLALGVLPKHQWNNLSPEEFQFSQNNTEPIGSGPFMIAEVMRDRQGLITEYKLVRHAAYPTPARLDELRIKFFESEAGRLSALAADTIDAAAFTTLSLRVLETEYPDLVADVLGSTVDRQPLPILFSVYFNQNRSPALRDQAAREALQAALDRSELNAQVFFGHAFPTPHPVPAGFYTVESVEASTTPSAGDILLAGGWDITEENSWIKEIDGSDVTLTVTLRTENRPEYLDMASYLAQTWEAVGVQVTTEAFEPSDLEFSVISPRNFEALLYGINVERHLDLYSFWHSSQKDDPGRNVSLYTNITTDALLENIRAATTSESKQAFIRDFLTEVTPEVPTIPLITPAMIYILDEGITYTKTDNIEDVSERLNASHRWYVREEEMWPLFIE